jgi:hypothetical protein
MADGVNPAVKVVQTPDAPPIGNRVVVEAGREELEGRDHTMLSRGHTRDQNVGCGVFMGIIAINRPHPTYVGASGRQTGAPRPLRHSSMRSS